MVTGVDEGGVLVGGVDVGEEVVGGADDGCCDVDGSDDGWPVCPCWEHRVVTTGWSCAALPASSPIIMFEKFSGAVCAVALGAGVGLADGALAVWLGPGADDGLMYVLGVVSVGLGLEVRTGMEGSSVAHWVDVGDIVSIECGVLEANGRPLLAFWLEELDLCPPAAAELCPGGFWLSADVETGWLSWGSTTVAAMATMASAPAAAIVGRTQEDSRLKCGRRRPAAAAPGGPPLLPPLPNEVRPLAATRNEVKIRCGRSRV